MCGSKPPTQHRMGSSPCESLAPARVSLGIDHRNKRTARNANECVNHFVSRMGRSRLRKVGATEQCVAYCNAAQPGLRVARTPHAAGAIKFAPQSRQVRRASFAHLYRACLKPSVRLPTNETMS